MYRYVNDGYLPIVGLPTGESLTEGEIRDALTAKYPGEDIDAALAQLVRGGYYVAVKGERRNAR